MWRPPHCLVVKTEALPAVFLQVMHAKHLLESGGAKSVAAAAKLAGLSRSALYKYKDSVFAFGDNASGGGTAAFEMELDDAPGVLSAVLSAVSRHGGNILTISQSPPASGTACVAMAVRFAGGADADMLSALKKLGGVRRICRTAGNETEKV